MVKRRYNGLLLLIVSYVCVIFFNVPAVNAKELADNGVFTFNETIGGEIINLDGDWEFYWKHLYSPIDFQNNNIQQGLMIVDVPSTWEHYYLNDEALPEEGFATYRLIIKFHEDDVNTMKALYLPNIASAYNVWIDGEKKASSGIVGKNRETMEPKSKNQIVPFQIKSQTVELIIQVSNFNRSTVAGIYKTIQLGEQETILHYRDQKVIYRSVVAISLLTMGLYHLVLYLFGRKERALIFFGMACLFAAMRTTLLENELLEFFFPHLDWEVMVKLALNGATLGVLFFVLFTYTQFPKDMSSKSKNIIILLMSLYSVFIMVTPAIVYTKTMDFLEVIFIFIFAYLLYIYLITYIRKREGALLNVMASLILLLCAVNDFFYFNQMIRTTELTSAGFLFFLFTQSINISKRFSKSFEKTEKLSRDLRLLNESLEKQVYDRTMELQKVNNKLHITNEKLLEAQQSRSRLIQNISHEISTPLTNVMSYSKAMLDKVIPNDEKYVQIIYDKSSYIAQMLDDLRSLTNIENRKILFQLEKVNIREYTHLLYSKYKNDLESQGIVFEFKDEVSEDAELYVMMDKMRIEQVIVNLLSNASKFVKEDGYILFKLAKREEGYVVISVEDNGIGIIEDEIEYVFERFFRSLNQVNEYQGSGLGLAISKEIIEFHNGQIYVESSEGEGSCFYFTLPLSNNHIS